MKIAVPVWEGRLSPVFDTARRLVCFEVAGGRVSPAGETLLAVDQPEAVGARLQELGVSTVLCGAISQPMAAMLCANGIQVQPFLAGELGEIVEAFARGRLHARCFHMPGCCGGRQRRRHGCCGNRETRK